MFREKSDRDSETKEKQRSRERGVEDRAFAGVYGVRPWPNDGFVRYALRKFEQKTAGYFSADSAHLIQRVA